MMRSATSFKTTLSSVDRTRLEAGSLMRGMLVRCAARRLLRACLTNVECAASRTSAMESGDRLIGLARIRHFNECKSSRATSIAVRDQADAFYGAMSLEEGTNRFLRGPEIQVAYENVLQVIPLHLMAGYSRLNGNLGQAMRDVKRNLSIAAFRAELRRNPQMLRHASATAAPKHWIAPGEPHRRDSSNVPDCRKEIVPEAGSPAPRRRRPPRSR
jgi:hypothetical protein